MFTSLISCNDISITEQIVRNLIRIDDGACIFFAKTANEALGMIEHQDQQIDIFIIDVCLKDIGGYKLESILRNIKKYRDTPVIFLTKTKGRVNTPSHLSTYQTYRKCNYLSLPVDDLDVQSKVSLYLDHIKEQHIKRKATKKVVFKHTKGYVRLDLQSIIFVEVQNKNCHLHTLQGEFLLKGKSLKSIQTELVADSSDSELIRCHRSYLLNLRHLVAIDLFSRKNWLAAFHHTTETCPISHSYIKEVYRRYTQNN